MSAEQERPSAKPAPLTDAQRWLDAGTGLAGTALAALGGYESYDAVKQVAADHHFHHPGLFPLGLDTAVVTLFLAELRLARRNMSFPPLRWGAWMLVGATIWWNAATSAGNVLGMAMHATAPLLVVAWIESIRHAVRVRAQMAARRHIERSPLARWLLAPVATFRMWRAQCLWNVTSYAEAIALDQRRLLVKARLRERYGWTRHGFFWWALTPAKERIALRLGLQDTTPPTELAEPAPPPAIEVRELAAVPALPQPKPTAATVRANGSGPSARAIRHIQRLRAEGQPRPDKLHILLHQQFGVERTQARRLAERHWPATGPSGGQPAGEGAA